MRDWFVRLAALTITAMLLTAAYYRVNSSTVMTLAAQHFLASLTPEQRAQATFPFQADERQNWHYIPKERKGLPLLDMQPHQKALAHALLAAGLSQQGYIRAVTIMSLEDVLRIMENADPNYRNPQKYYFTIFGEPSDTGTWGYRVEGHHLSQNFTVVNGKIADTPSFFGANPAEVREGPRKGLRVLGAEEIEGRPGSFNTKIMKLIEANAFAMVEHAVKKATEGDYRAMKYLFELLEHFESRVPPERRNSLAKVLLRYLGLTDEMIAAEQAAAEAEEDGLATREAVENPVE